MRIFAFILSLYITTLSVVQCADAMPPSSNHSDIEVSLAENEHNHSDHKDDCTPFCACACCGSIVTLTTVQSLIATKIEISTDYLFYYTSDYSFDYNKGVWRPPTLS
jgi:hypothetical protein